MKKSDEIEQPTSCLNKAQSDEPIFVLRAKDPAASRAVRHWADICEAQGTHETGKIAEARRLANEMDRWREFHSGRVKTMR
jgi:hypothetical protein